MQANRIERRTQRQEVQNERRHSTGDSPIASLESTATTGSATAPKDDSSPQIFTGAYLYEQLIETEEKATTRMDIVKTAVAKVATFADWKKALADMVSIPKKQLENVTKTAKDAGVDVENASTPDMVLWGTRLKSAQQAQRNMRNIFGAMRLFKDDLEGMLAQAGKKGGYIATSEIAATMLQTKRVKWDGTPIKSDDEKDALALRREEKAFEAKIKEDNPQRTNESLREYNDRVMELFDREWQSHLDGLAGASLEKQASDLIKKLGDNARTILETALRLLDTPKDEVPHVLGENAPNVTH